MATPHGIDRSGAAGGTGAPEMLNALGELADPGKDALIYWDDSAGDFVWVGFTGGDTPTDGKIIVGDGTNWVTESGATARASLGSTSVGDAVFIAANAAAGRTALDVPSNSEAILDTIIDAAGDLIVGTAADTPARLALGTARQVLRVNAAATAPVWEAAITLGTPQATTSGTAIDFTGIPAGVKKLQLSLVDFSTNGTSGIQVQIGDAGGPETSGYLGAATLITTAVAASNVTSGFLLVRDMGAAANVVHGVLTLTLVDAATFTWAATFTGAMSAAVVLLGAGSKSLTAELTQLRLTTLNGTDTFDAGKVNIQYQ